MNTIVCGLKQHGDAGARVCWFGSLRRAMVSLQVGPATVFGTQLDFRHRHLTGGAMYSVRRTLLAIVLSHLMKRVSCGPMLLAVASVYLAVLCIPSFAQSTAAIEGVVKDPSGAVLPNAQITATERATQ